MPVDWGRLRRDAHHQCDLVTRAQCLAAGLSDAAQQWRVTSGRWVRVHDGVFLTRPGRQGWAVTATAELVRALSPGPSADAALCGRSALHLWGLQRRPPPVVQLVVPYGRALRRRDGVSVRRSMRWADLVDEVAFPWRTTLAATVLDVAAEGSPTDGLALVARAVQKELVSVGQLRDELGRRAGHRHSRVLRPALGDIDAGGQSGAELLYVRDVERAHGLPRGRRQAASDLGGRRYHDTGYDEFGLVVEVDGRLGHERWADRVRDGRRDRTLLAAATATARVFWVDVALTPCRTAVEVGAVLSARGWSGRLRRCRRPDCVVGCPPSGRV